MNPYATDAFLRRLYADAPKGRDLMECEAADFPALAQAARTRFTDALGLGRIRALGAAETPVLRDEQKRDGCRLETYDFTFLPDLTAPVHRLVPDAGNGQTILYLIGHGPGAKGVISPDPLSGDVPLPLRFAGLGYTVLVPELIGFGQTVSEDHLTAADRGCTANALHLLLHGMTLAGLRTAECERLLDWALPSGPKGRLISYGMSGGGMLNTALFALEPRIDAAVIASYPNTFGTSILAMHHCLCNYFPGILEIGDIAQLIALGAPKPVLISSGTEDPIFPLEGTKRCWDDLSAVYEKLGAADACELELFPGKHEISTGRVFRFLEKQLTEV